MSPRFPKGVSSRRRPVPQVHNPRFGCVCTCGQGSCTNLNFCVYTCGAQLGILGSNIRLSTLVNL
jgi:hypothetical protein